MKNNLEILAPVGSFDSLKAAVSNGANAVYLGGKEFSARASANNFDRTELKEAVEYAHIRGVCVFVTVNTLIKETEVEDFIEYIGYLYNIGADAVILQDIGMATLVKSHYPNLELHASTQMAAHSLEDVLFLEKVGFKRVVLARELNIGEIKYIVDNSSADIEIFVHGALCVAYSGQCLMSSILGTRSGNRGRCAQPCRQRYKMYDVDNKKYIDTDGSYLLSPRDLNTVEDIGKIIDTGVLSLKIEGRMKKPEYVATVVSTYRYAVDNYINTKDEKISPKYMDNLYSIFNRKFTKGYILNEVGIDVMNSEKPNNRGLYIGKSISYNKKTKKLKIKLDKELKKGDCLNIGGGNIGRILKDGSILDKALPGDIIEIDFVGDIKPETDLYKTLDQELINTAKSTFSTNDEIKKIPVYIEAFLYKDSPIILNIEDDDGNFISVSGEKNIEQAIKVPLDEDKVKKQLAKLGNTPFEASRINVSLEDNSSLPVSEINNTRRLGLEKLSEIRANTSFTRKNNISNCKVDKTIDKSDTDFLNKILPFKSNRNTYDSKIKINVSVSNIEQLKAIIDLDIDTIYYKDINTLEYAVDLCNSHNIHIVYQLPRIIRVFEKKVYNFLSNIDRKTLDKLDGFRVSNYGEINFLNSTYPDKPIYISPWLNVINSRSISFYKKLNSHIISLSQEMSFNQIKNISKDEVDTNNLEYLVYGRREMMISEYCPMGVLTKDCKKNKRDSICNQSKYCLESSNGERFRLKQDENCRTTIYSNDVLNLIDEIHDLDKYGIYNYEVDLTFENKEESKIIVEEFVNTKLSKKTSSKLENLNLIFEKGHFYKEID